jgi:hypothetical protein
MSPLADAQLYALWATKINHGDWGIGDGARIGNGAMMFANDVQQ